MHSVWVCVLFWRVGAWKGMGCVVEKSPGNISSELKVQPIQNQTCTEYKTHSLVHPFWCYNSYWTKHWSIFGGFFWRVMGFSVTSCIFQKSSMSSPRALIQMIFMRLWQELKLKRNIEDTLICSTNRETLRNLPGNFQCRERGLFPVKQGIWLLLTSSYPPAIQDLPPQQRLLNFKCHGE